MEVDDVARRCAIISYDFSTQIMGGSIRMVKLAQYLTSHGWHPHVITASPPDEHPRLDGVKISHIASAERSFGGGIAAGAAGSVLGGNPWWLRGLAGLKKLLPLERQLTWFSAFRQHAPKALAGERIDVVVCTCAPYVMMILGHWLARKLQVPHVVDLRDDWEDRFLIEKRTWLNRRVLRAFAMRIVRASSALVVVSPVTQKRFERLGMPVHLVANGYDEPDFAGISFDPQPASKDGPLEIVHLGWLGDFRSIEPVLRALERTSAQTSEVSPRIVFRQVGLLEESQLRAIEASAVRALVRIDPQVTHADAIRLMSESDALLVIPGTRIRAALTGKLFEYLRARRPILLIANEGAATEVAREMGLRHVCAPDDIDGIVVAMATMLDEKRRGRLMGRSDSDAVSRYDRRNQAVIFARVLDGVVGATDPTTKPEAQGVETR